LKLIDHWSSSERAAETSGRMQAGTEASRYSGGSGRKSTSFGQMELWTDECPDGMTCCPNDWQGTEISDLYNSAESSETLLNSGILLKKHLYIQVILSNQNEANYKLTISNIFVAFCISFPTPPISLQFET
jgi:hypothetical protein